MKRKALIIQSHTNSDDQTFISGVSNDARNMRLFLSSSNGGAWQLRKDLVHLINPSSSQLRQVLRKIQGSDLAIIYYTGHGLRYGGEEYLNINNDEVFQLRKLFRLSQRLLIITDTCRVNPYTSFLGEVGDPYTGYSFDYENQDFARRLYNSLVMRSDFGKTWVSSGSPDEYSYSSSLGGAFTRNLLETFEETYLELGHKYREISSCFHEARIKTSAQTFETPQNPIMYSIGTLGLDHFPIVINPTIYQHLIEERNQRRYNNWY